MSPEKKQSLEEMVAQDAKTALDKKGASAEETPAKAGLNLDAVASQAGTVFEEGGEPDVSAVPDANDTPIADVNLDEGDTPEGVTAGDAASKGGVVLDEGSVPMFDETPEPTAAPKPKTVLDEGDDPEPIGKTAEGKKPAKVSQEETMPTEIPKGVTRERISGVFSTQTVAKVGTGTTVRKTIQKAYWFAEELSPDDEGVSVVLVQPLNNNNIPSGPKEQVPVDDFLGRFNPELEFYQQEVYPKMKELDATVKRAEDQRDQGALYSAEFEFAAALSFDESNVRANFGLGLTYMERGEPEKAGDIFERVVHLDAAFAPEHKHLFNEFGINLRKSKLHDQAVEYYTRALEITDNDENLYYNIARAYFERGDREECIENLNKALEIRPDFEEVQMFLEYLEKNKG